MIKTTNKRFKDKKYWDTTIFEQGYYVICPKCEGMAIVKLNHDGNQVSDWCKSCPRAIKCGSNWACQLNFRCTACGDLHTKRRDNGGALTAKGTCINCDRYFRVELDDDKKGFNLLNVKCPHCHVVNTAKVHENRGHKNDRVLYCRVSHGPVYNGYRLYFNISYKGNPIWAYNRAHLQYLIDFIEADIRDAPMSGTVAKGLSYRLPKFMHLARNRDGILKLLRRMQSGS